MNLKTILISSAVLLFTDSVFAQEVEQNIRMVKPFKADGISNEWNEPLNQYNSDTKLAFALANDDKNLYIVIESLDPVTTRSILFGGITLNINVEGKKKKGINLIFPFREKPELPKGEKPIDSTQRVDISERKSPQGMPNEKGMPPFDRNNGLKVSGFKNIKDGILSVHNEFGVESGMSVKPNQDLIYEFEIPLIELQASLNSKKPIAYNIKLNASSKGSTGEKPKGAPPEGGKSGGGMGGGGEQRGGGGMGGPRGGGQRPSGGDGESSGAKKSDFWIKYKLVKA